MLAIKRIKEHVTTVKVPCHLNQTMTWLHPLICKKAFARRWLESHVLDLSPIAPPIAISAHPLQVLVLSTIALPSASSPHQMFRRFYMQQLPDPLHPRSLWRLRHSNEPRASSLE